MSETDFCNKKITSTSAPFSHWCLQTYVFDSSYNSLFIQIDTDLPVDSTVLFWKHHQNKIFSFLDWNLLYRILKSFHTWLYHNHNGKLVIGIVEYYERFEQLDHFKQRCHCYCGQVPEGKIPFSSSSTGKYPKHFPSMAIQKFRELI